MGIRIAVGTHTSPIQTMTKSITNMPAMPPIAPMMIPLGMTLPSLDR